MDTILKVSTIETTDNPFLGGKEAEPEGFSQHKTGSFTNWWGTTQLVLS